MKYLSTKVVHFNAFGFNVMSNCRCNMVTLLNTPCQSLSIAYQRRHKSETQKTANLLRSEVNESYCTTNESSHLA